MYLFDDRVPAVGFVRGDGVQHVGWAVVKNAWNPHTSNRVPCPAAAFSSALKSGIRRATSRPGTRSAFFWAAKAVNGTSAISAMLHAHGDRIRAKKTATAANQPLSRFLSPAVSVSGLDA